MLDERASEARRRRSGTFSSSTAGELSGARARPRSRAFRDLVRELRAVAEELPLPALLDELLAKTGYTDLYRREDDEEQAALENIREFLTRRRRSSPSRRAYGAATTRTCSPRSSTTSLWSPTSTPGAASAASSLMTLHSRQGARVPGRLPARPRGRPAAALQRAGQERGRRGGAAALLRRHDAGERAALPVDCRRRRDRRPLPGPARIAAPRRGADGAARGHREPEPLPHGAHARRRRVLRPTRRRRSTRSSRRPAAAQAGRRVRHPTLGHGVILEIEGEGDDAKFTVFFDRAGKKKLIARYASLELV